MRVSVAILAGLMASAAAAQSRAPWVLPNFSDRVDLVVENPSALELKSIAVVPMAEVRAIAPGFPGTLAIVIESTQPAHFVPSQIDDLNGSGQPDEFVLAVQLAPHQTQSLSIYYSKTLHDVLPVAKRVHAAHNYGYNHATAAIESELIGYRTYGGFFFDVQAHAHDQLGLFNSFLGYSSIAAPPAEGQDVVHLGDTLGLGGLFLRAGGSIYRPPLNTPAYTHHAPKPEEPIYRIVSDGPLRAIVEARLPHWTIGDDAVSLRAIYEIRAGEELVRCRWWATPLHLSRSYDIGAGVRDLPQMKTVEADHVVVTTGIQEAKVGPIALGLSFPPAQARRAGRLMTPDGANEIIVFSQHLTAGSTVSGDYAFAAAWSGTGWQDPAAHLRNVLHNEPGQPDLKLLAHFTNPEPQRVEGEPQ